MKRLILLLSMLWPLFASAQLYHPGEKLEYRVSYRAKYFPNTEIGEVEVTTEEVTFDQKPHYRVIGVGRTLPTYRWFFNMEDSYTIHIDPTTLRTQHFQSDIKEASYTFQSSYRYDWSAMEVSTRWSSRGRPFKEAKLPLTERSMDAISLFFNMRSASADDFKEGGVGTLEMVLEDTVRHINYRYLGREVKKIRNQGKFRALKFECQLGTTEGYSFTDGTVFTLWISDDRNKIPLSIESPVRIGSIQAYIYDFEGLKYPLDSKVK